MYHRNRLKPDPRNPLWIAIAGALGGGAALSFQEQILALPGLIAYWPLIETSGTVATNAQGDTGLNATYVNSPSLATALFPASDNVALFDKSNDCVDLYNTDFPSSFDGNNGWLMLWVKDSATGLATGNVLYAYADSSNRLYVDSFSGYARYPTLRAGGGNVYYGVASSGSVWRQICIQWGTKMAWYDGVPIPLWSNTQNIWSGTLGTLTAIGATTNAGVGSFNGSVGHVAFGGGAAAILTDELVSSIYDTVYPIKNDIIACGDSKTHQDLWPAITASLLSDSTGSVWRQPYYQFAAPGYTVAQLHTLIDANAPVAVGNPAVAMINIGANDAASPPSESGWKADLVGCVDGLRAKWPAIEVYISKIWMASQPANCATINSWIDDIVASQSYIYAGPDESIWLENGDNGATYTTDGTHYNAAGNIEAANQWVAVLTA